MSKQEIFDKVWAGLSGQGWQQSADGVDDEGRAYCKYRGPNGLRCAAGHLIPDDKYDPRMEGRNAFVALDFAGMALESGEIGLVYALQLAHDQSDTPADMELGVRQVALEYDLKVPA